MGQVVLYIVDRTAKMVGGKCLGEELGELAPPATVL
jgi:hypothetical protein